ncbi:ralBP1-associated Eps domain-containing 2-like isoform X2 [Labeo rohita]|uniref:RalBP1-associated Eps domain-containing 2-like isoform X2 n=1 Tax=Labeo rohita TaxID=84645 RepID=A0A498LK99_LABRO|nr:ralBP1-associated Eps domain-containing 2-like isoform X2 [Labeo rohita]
MDQGSAAGTGGTFISLSDTEQRCYSGLYTLCQPDSSGKPAAGKVAELFRASQLPAETLHQVTEVCGAKRLGYFGCGQFYVALKLMAAAQAGLPVRLESIAGELPLPVFVGITNEPEMRYSNQPLTSESQPHILGSVTGSAPRPPADRPLHRHPETSMDKQEAWSPPRSPGISPPRSPSAYRSYPYVAQRNGTDTLLAYDGKVPGRPSVSQENSSPSHYSLKPQPEQPVITRVSISSFLNLIGRSNRTLGVASVERLVERVEVDYSDDPWRITEEQREYYTNQFRSLQPDLSALIMGTVAKNFFTKSKLPIPELSHIWELSDVDKDGALTFPEFCTAFHLIVARKNGYPLPETLPATLRPGFVESEFSPKRIPDPHEKPIQSVSTLKPGAKSGWLPPPPALPPRPPATQIFSFLPGSEKSSQKAVQQPNFADFSKFREEQESNVRGGLSTEDLTPSKLDSTVMHQGHAPQKPVRRKLHPESQSATPPSATPYSAATLTKSTQRSI